MTKCHTEEVSHTLKIILMSKISYSTMTKHLLAGAKNTLSQCHTGEKCHTGIKWCGRYVTCDNSFKQAQSGRKLMGRCEWAKT